METGNPWKSNNLAQISFEIVEDVYLTIFQQFPNAYNGDESDDGSYSILVETEESVPTISYDLCSSQGSCTHSDSISSSADVKFVRLQLLPEDESWDIYVSENGHFSGSFIRVTLANGRFPTWTDFDYTDPSDCTSYYSSSGGFHFSSADCDADCGGDWFLSIEAIEFYFYLRLKFYIDAFRHKGRLISLTLNYLWVEEDS